ncbi:hypothetical protein CANCADRAFT_128772 [Tortispora caseinolytica NRRL Y-17796]|uniref:Uncharacterized protein n=1 Tax=Tortispora caseinolytica NRRL Y-17796 TaxID=767744 RepID=A0A1E4TAZ0_9ASCO|nr:hypothetical protein CANCADRAFT_128772 [Tortispora caseinolytica NRRL Y-17796]
MDPVTAWLADVIRGTAAHKPATVVISVLTSFFVLLAVVVDICTLFLQKALTFPLDNALAVLDLLSDKLGTPPLPERSPSFIGLRPWPQPHKESDIRSDDSPIEPLTPESEPLPPLVPDLQPNREYATFGVLARSDETHHLRAMANKYLGMAPVAPAAPTRESHFAKVSRKLSASIARFRSASSPNVIALGEGHDPSVCFPECPCAPPEVKNRAASNKSLKSKRSRKSNKSKRSRKSKNSIKRGNSTASSGHSSPSESESESDSDSDSDPVSAEQPAKEEINTNNDEDDDDDVFPHDPSLCHPECPCAPPEIRNANI